MSACYGVNPGDAGIEVPREWSGTAATPVTADTAFNGFVCTHVVFAFERLGVFARFAEAGSLDMTGFCAEHGLDDAVFRALVGAAESFGHVTVTGDRVLPTEHGEEVRRQLGFFTWAVGGYHDVFAAAAPIATGKRAFGSDVLRDEAMVALGSAQADTALMRHILDAEIAQVDFSVLADLGSGTCERLSRLVKDRPGARGIGLDISRSATELAARTVAGYGLRDRVEPVCADVRQVVAGELKPEGAAEVDAVMSFMFLHDLLADPSTRSRVIPEMREAFPNARTFLLADTTIRPRGAAERTLPMFSSGFELAHALMGVPLHTRQDYERLFVDAGLTIRRTVPFGAPHTYLFVLEA
ncbi:SAM-dependent methyltransferase [Allokutzneria oryzae]|uniref:SAM-dependent methyltransferase n=1 Tax=Allokutzneria oryzae TaxID=1378989 RepID=A0ABV5ZRR7_9PSEU